MASDITVVAGIEIPCVSPVFLTVVGIHVLLGIACVITGVMAMLSEKRHGRRAAGWSLWTGRGQDFSWQGLLVAVTALPIMWTP
jgi:hypothetical protein